MVVTDDVYSFQTIKKKVNFLPITYWLCYCCKDITYNFKFFQISRQRGYTLSNELEFLDQDRTLS